MKPWKTLSRRMVLNHSKWLVVEDHAVELPGGRVIPNWPWVTTPDYINVVVETVDGKFLCFRQTKYAIAGTTLAVVGGYLEPGEEPLTCAQRELREETGYVAPEWINLGSYWVDPNRGMATGNLFLARGAYRVCNRDADDLEEQEVLLLTRAEIESALAAGEFKVLAWQAAVALALLNLAKVTDLRKVGIQSKEGDMPEIKHLPRMYVAYVSEVGPFGDAVKRGFERLFAWIGANQVQPLGASLGIYYDDPAHVPAEKLRSELCVPVAPDVQGSGDVGVKAIGDCDVAALVYQGEANISRAYNEVYAWLRAQGYREAGAPIETYLSRPGEELRAEIAVPVVKVEKKIAAKKPKRAVKRSAKKTAKKKK